MLKPSLQLKLGQQLTMTPQLQQAIRLLQLPTIELQAHIREAHGFDKADREHFDSLLHGSIKQSLELREDITPLIDRKGCIQHGTVFVARLKPNVDRS